MIALALVLCRSTSLQFGRPLTPSGKSGELQSLSLDVDGWAGEGPHVIWMIRLTSTTSTPFQSLVCY